MAYIIGVATEEEIIELKRRGWNIEKPPKELISIYPPGHKMAMVFVDSDLFDIMNGPDWDHGEMPAVCKIQGPECSGINQKSKSHRWNGGWVCSNCWDERLRSTE